MTTRAEHLAWCKRRALECVDRGELHNAVASMVSDLAKHPRTAGAFALPPLGMASLLEGDAAGVRQFIEGHE